MSEWGRGEEGVSERHRDRGERKRLKYLTDIRHIYKDTFIEYYRIHEVFLYGEIWMDYSKTYFITEISIKILSHLLIARDVFY